MAEEQKTEDTCPVCGVRDFEWGWLHPWGEKLWILYTPDDCPPRLGTAGLNIKARRCRQCSRLDLFARE
jgi:hypothetical protein